MRFLRQICWLTMFFWLLSGFPLSAQIRTDTSQFYQNLVSDTGDGEFRFMPMGSSMSKRIDSYWPEILESKLNELTRGDVFFNHSAAISRMTSRAALSSPDFHPLDSIAAFQPHAVSIEFTATDIFEGDETEDGVPITLSESKQNLIKIIDSIRTLVPDVEVFLYATGLPWSYWSHIFPQFKDYYAMMEEVAIEKQSYFVNTYDPLFGIYDSLCSAFKCGEWNLKWMRDTHHPSINTGLKVIVPSFLSVMSGGVIPSDPIEELFFSFNRENNIFFQDNLITFYVGNVPDTSYPVFELSLDTGESWDTIRVQPERDFYKWQPPDTILSDSALIRASVDSQTVFSPFFSIISREEPKDPIIILPLDTNEYRVGDTVLIAWEKDTNSIATVDVFYSPDGQQFLRISEVSIDTLEFAWVIESYVDSVYTASDSGFFIVADYTTPSINARSDTISIKERPTSLSTKSKGFGNSVHLKIQPNIRGITQRKSGKTAKYYTVDGVEMGRTKERR